MVTLHVLARALEHLNEAIALTAGAAIRDGATYGAVGRALGVSRQAVRQALTRRLSDLDSAQETRDWGLPVTIRHNNVTWSQTR